MLLLFPSNSNEYLLRVIPFQARGFFFFAIQIISRKSLLLNYVIGSRKHVIRANATPSFYYKIFQGRLFCHFAVVINVIAFRKVTVGFLGLILLLFVTFSNDSLKAVDTRLQSAICARKQGMTNGLRICFNWFRWPINSF